MTQDVMQSHPVEPLLTKQQWDQVSLLAAAVDMHLSVGPGRTPVVSAAVAVIEMTPSVLQLTELENAIHTEFDRAATQVALPRQGGADTLLPLDRNAAIDYLARQRDRRLEAVSLATDGLALLGS